MQYLGAVLNEVGGLVHHRLRSRKSGLSVAADKSTDLTNITDQFSLNTVQFKGILNGLYFGYVSIL